MRISRVQIENYRNLRNINIELKSIVALIGENNSGKSNFLRAIAIPLYSDDSGIGKRLSWYDINKKARDDYYEYLKTNRKRIINGELMLEELIPHIPAVTIELLFQPEENEHYCIKNIIVDESNWTGGILYRYYVKSPDKLYQRIKSILTAEHDFESVQMSLLPMELYEYSITVPGKGSSVSHDVLWGLRSVELPAERDYFASSTDKLGSRALTDILKRELKPESQAAIEKQYYEFFETVKNEGNFDKVFNWQDYSDIENAKSFFEKINILPNMPQMSSILGSIRLGYVDDYMFAQGLGHRNLVLMTVLLNSYLSKKRDISFRLMTVEEPEAHLCVSNTLLIANILNRFSQKDSYTQIVYSTHNAELINKLGLDKVIVMCNGEAFSLDKELTEKERNYLAANPNTDIFKLLYSRKTILVEGFTEELLIKSFFLTCSELNEIAVLSFHKGFKKIIDIWEKVNKTSGNKLGIVRDYDDEEKSKRAHEEKQSE